MTIVGSSKGPIPSPSSNDPQKQREVKHAGHHFVSQRPGDAPKKYYKADLQSEQVDHRKQNKICGQKNEVSVKRHESLPYQGDGAKEGIQSSAGDLKLVMLSVA